MIRTLDDAMLELGFMWIMKDGKVNQDVVARILKRVNEMEYEDCDHLEESLREKVDKHLENEKFAQLELEEELRQLEEEGRF
jgi:hypothetical protein